MRIKCVIRSILKKVKDSCITLKGSFHNASTGPPLSHLRRGWTILLFSFVLQDNVKSEVLVSIDEVHMIKKRSVSWCRSRVNVASTFAAFATMAVGMN